MKNTIYRKLNAAWKSPRVQKFSRSIWVFPAILTLILVILCSLQVSGSSIGVYHDIFYGKTSDSNLIVNKPELIRSDEWTVGAQKAVEQKNNNFKTVNQNVGNGEDESVIGDSPVKDWSIILKPQNIGFLVLPFDNAYSLKWWLLSYLLVLSAYFFALYFLPKMRLLSSLLALSLLFSPFFHWWYTSGTFSPVYFALFGFVVFTKVLEAKTSRQALLWSLVLAYIAAAFTVNLYPPFQIPVALVALALCVGYVLNARTRFRDILFKTHFIYLIASLMLAALVVGIFVYQHTQVISIIQNTSYPGQRSVSSGGFSKIHLLASDLGGLLQAPQSAVAYNIPAAGAVNQSESSNFILLIPALLIPILYLAYRNFKIKRKIDFYIISLMGVGVLFLAWLFIPGIEILGKITLLTGVPLNRTLIGIGLLNFILLVYFLKLYLEKGARRLALYPSIVYFLLLLIFYLVINTYVAKILPGFISFKLAIALAFPIPIIVFLLIRKHIKSALILLCLFSLLSVCFINPLYKGTSVLTKTPLLSAIREVNGNSTKKWVSEDIIIENFASMAGVHSITGTQLYPQNSLWANLDQPTKKTVYNRYAHVNFTFDRSPNQSISPVLTNPGADQLNIRIEPCDTFFHKADVGFLITSVAFTEPEASCLTYITKVTYPNLPFYIYSVNI
jgi:hypothetical protein